MSKHEQYDLVEIGKRLRELRANQRKTQGTMAKELGISLSHYSKLEIGIGGMSHGLALALCRQFNLPEEWLLYGTGEKPDLANVKANTRGQRNSSSSSGLSDEYLEEIVKTVLDEDCQKLANMIAGQMNISLARAMVIIIKEKLRKER